MEYDIIVLGGGPGGYLAAERAGQAQKKVLCIEEAHLGGTCLNEGCIPTKPLLYSGKLYAHAKHSQAYDPHAGGRCGRYTESLSCGCCGRKRRHHRPHRRWLYC